MRSPNLSKPLDTIPFFKSHDYPLPKSPSSAIQSSTENNSHYYKYSRNLEINDQVKHNKQYLCRALTEYNSNSFLNNYEYDSRSDQTKFDYQSKGDGMEQKYFRHYAYQQHRRKNSTMKKNHSKEKSSLILPQKSVSKQKQVLCSQIEILSIQNNKLQQTNDKLLKEIAKLKQKFEYRNVTKQFHEILSPCKVNQYLEKQQSQCRFPELSSKSNIGSGFQEQNLFTNEQFEQFYKPKNTQLPLVNKSQQTHKQQTVQLLKKAAEEIRDRDEKILLLENEKQIWRIKMEKQENKYGNLQKNLQGQFTKLKAIIDSYSQCLQNCKHKINNFQLALKKTKSIIEGFVFSIKVLQEKLKSKDQIIQLKCHQIDRLIKQTHHQKLKQAQNCIKCNISKNIFQTPRFK